MFDSSSERIPYYTGLFVFAFLLEHLSIISYLRPHPDVPQVANIMVVRQPFGMNVTLHDQPPG
jgi:hypothetical protein